MLTSDEIIGLMEDTIADLTLLCRPRVSDVMGSLEGDGWRVVDGPNDWVAYDLIPPVSDGRAR